MRKQAGMAGDAEDFVTRPVREFPGNVRNIWKKGKGMVEGQVDKGKGVAAEQLEKSRAYAHDKTAPKSKVDDIKALLGRMNIHPAAQYGGAAVAGGLAGAGIGGLAGGRKGAVIGGVTGAAMSPAVLYLAKALEARRGKAA